MSDKDIVEEAREILNASNAYTIRIGVRELLGALADEVERLRGEVAVHRGLKTMGDEGARLFAEGESEELNAIYECDKCDLCEDHYE